LGRIPRDIKYIDSLVVFNSRLNPYQNYQYINNTESNIQRNLPLKKNQKNKGAIDLTEAPKTLLEGDVLQQFRTEEHRFIPAAKELPQLKVRDQLDLAGIVSYAFGDGDLDTGMTPSRGGTVNRPTISDPKFLNEPTSNIVQQSNLSIQRFSMSTPQQIEAVQNNANMQSQPSNNYSYAPVVSQNQNVNVQRGVQVTNPQPTVQTAAPVVNQTQTATNNVAPQPTVNVQPVTTQPQPQTQNAPVEQKPAPAKPAGNRGIG